MTGFLIAAIIIFALFQRRKYRRMCSGRHDKWSRRWDRMHSRSGAPGEPGNDKWGKWTRQWQEWEHWTHEARHHAADVGQKVASKLSKAEEKLRRNAERLRGADSYSTRPPSAGATTDSAGVGRN